MVWSKINSPLLAFFANKQLVIETCWLDSISPPHWIHPQFLLFLWSLQRLTDMINIYFSKSKIFLLHSFGKGTECIVSLLWYPFLSDIGVNLNVIKKYIFTHLIQYKDGCNDDIVQLLQFSKAQYEGVLSHLLSFQQIFYPIQPGNIIRLDTVFVAKILKWYIYIYCKVQKSCLIEFLGTSFFMLAVLSYGH